MANKVVSSGLPLPSRLMLSRVPVPEDIVSANSCFAGCALEVRATPAVPALPEATEIFPRKMLVGVKETPFGYRERSLRKLGARAGGCVKNYVMRCPKMGVWHSVD